MRNLNKMSRAERLKAWVKALRSGEFKQSRGMLHGPRGHCCLGVAQGISGCEDNENAVGGFFGLTYTQVGKLMSLNDHGHKSFSYIADYIEKKIA